MNIKSLFLPLAFLGMAHTATADQLIASSDSYPNTDTSECSWSLVAMFGTPPDPQFPNGTQTDVWGLDCATGSTNSAPPVSIIERTEMHTFGFGSSCNLSSPISGYRLEGNSCSSFKVFKSDTSEESTPTEQLEGLQRISNVWKTDQFIHVNHSAQQTVLTSNAPSGWWSSHWTFEEIGDYYRIKNRWTGEYLHMQSHELESGPIIEGWWSAQWTLQTGTLGGQTVYRIRNRWLPDEYLHIENGDLETGSIESGWHSAWWYIKSL